MSWEKEDAVTAAMIDLRAATVALERAAKRQAAGKLKRLVTEPHRVLRQRLLGLLGRMSEIDAPTFWGGRFIGMLPEGVSATIWRFGFTERAVCRSMLTRLKPGGVFIDVGAHFGFFTLLGSALVGETGRVLSVEATPSTRRMLQRNVARNGCANVSILGCAAHARDEPLTFRDFGPALSSLNSAFAARHGAQTAPYEQVAVAGRRLDDLVAEAELSQVDLVKIDAESSELQVLQGMDQVIERHRPAIVVEVGGGRMRRCRARSSPI